MLWYSFKISPTFYLNRTSTYCGMSKALHTVPGEWGQLLCEVAFEILYCMFLQNIFESFNGFKILDLMEFWRMTFKSDLMAFFEIFWPQCVLLGLSSLKSSTMPFQLPLPSSAISGHSAHVQT